MRCQVRERGCPYQSGSDTCNRQCPSAHCIRDRQPTNKPNCSSTKRKRSSRNDQHTSFQAFLPSLAPDTHPSVLTAPEIAAVIKFPGQIFLSKEDPGGLAAPQTLPSLSTRSENSPRSAALQQCLTLKKLEWHFQFPRKATAHRGIFQSMSTHTHIQKR